MNEPNHQGVTPRLAGHVATELKALLAGIPVGREFDVKPSQEICSSLELLVPALLRVRHPEWDRESLDGVFVARARKTGDAAVQLAGTCILISDQTVTAFLVDLSLSSSGESIGSYRVRLGTPGGGPLGISGPECDSPEAKELLVNVVTRLKDICWSYSIASDDE
jgi:hypothetical protein